VEFAGVGAGEEHHGRRHEQLDGVPSRLPRAVKDNVERNPPVFFRREFMLGLPAAVIGPLTTASLFAADSASPPSGEPAVGECLDYGRSFVCHSGPYNAVRLWIESRTTIVDEESGTVSHFYQCGSCKSERTFAEKDLFYENNYDFLPIVGHDRTLMFRRHIGVNPDYRDIRDVVKPWGTPILRLHNAADALVLDTWPKIQQAIESGAPIICRTTLADEATRLRAVVEYPVKTMNMNVEKQLWQTDTGPIALPDLSKRYEHPIESLRLAFVAANRNDEAYFVVEQPTPLTVDDKQVAEVRHFSQPFGAKATNVLLAHAV
jgi:hypothetical protein